ncbi:hypothetical protein P9869_19350 [Streptomyces ossamyceticus]|nr:hypothetical protein [Streptomyces ossamyceticus]
MLGDRLPLPPRQSDPEDWTLEVPASKGVASLRPIRDEIEQRVRALIAEIDAR